MKCPNCGQEIADGHLYCEKCGMEIRIVPDFEPEIENSIIETLSTVAESIEDDPGLQKDSFLPKESAREEKSEPDDFFREEPGRKGLAVRLITVTVILLVLVILALVMYFNYSAAYQVDKARSAAAQGRYAEAVRYLDQAIALEEDNVDIVLLQANYYYTMGNSDRAVAILLDLIHNKEMSLEDAEKVYDHVIAIYSEQKHYEEINELLLDCQETEIVTLFQNYLAMEPEFSYTGGTYNEVIPLKLSANTTGKIYYTLDGTIPNLNSTIYMAPIFLESGDYVVTALFVNDYGIESEIVQKRYHITLTVPDRPRVLPYSGRYEIPTMIEIEPVEGGTIYYTTDGSDPIADSQVYTQPIQIPLGRTNYKFRVISDEGVSSEVVSRSYEFAPATTVTPEAAALNVTRALMNRDVLTDLQGHARGMNGRYLFVYENVITIGENYYYELVEYYEDANGNQSRTGLLYAVELYTGSPNRLIYDEQGEMGLISLVDSQTD